MSFIDPVRFLEKMALEGKVTERYVKVVIQSETLVSVSFINLTPSRAEEGRGGGAEGSNNHQMFFLNDAGGGKVRLSHAVNSLRSPWRPQSAPSLRGRTAEPDAIAAYLGAYLSATAEAVEPVLTHESPTHI